MTDHPDLTMTLDPSELWPDPAACPDWPLVPNTFNRAMTAPGSREQAAQRLRDLGRMLDNTDMVRAPTPAERASLRQRYFRAGSVVNWKWDQLGRTGTAPASPAVEREAQLIADACHLRGYIRRLDEAAQAEPERAEAARLESLHRRADDAPETLRRLEDQLAALADAEARFLQSQADQRAAALAHDLRHQIDGVRAEAAQARRALDAA